MPNIAKEPFGKTSDGHAVELCTLRNGKGEEAKVITYGARLVSWTAHAKDGNPVDVVLGYDSMAGYEQDDKFMGAIAGRCANRIGGASFELNGRTYELDKNDGSRKQNHLHGGFRGFDKQLWQARETSEGLELSYTSPAGEGGYPGTLTATVSYSLSDDGELDIRYRAQTDEDTVCNLTNHAYFNLDGFAAGSVLGQRIQILADSYTWADAESLPDGRILPVEGTPMDLREPTPIGKHIEEDFDQLAMGRGYDHNWVLREAPDAATGLRKAACAASDRTGLALTVYTDLPGIQFYSGNYLDGVLTGKQGAHFGLRSGFCLETQYYPNALHCPGFPQPILRKGEIWKSRTVYALRCAE